MQTDHYTYPTEAMERCIEPKLVEPLIDLSMLLNGFRESEQTEYRAAYPVIRRLILMELLKRDRPATVMAYLMGNGLIIGV